MDELVRAYIDFINYYDPFWEAYEDPEEVYELEASEMLYNLLEMEKDFLTNAYMADDTAADLLTKVRDVIGLFKTKGVTTK